MPAPPTPAQEHGDLCGFMVLPSAFLSKRRRHFYWAESIYRAMRPERCMGTRQGLPFSLLSALHSKQRGSANEPSQQPDKAMVTPASTSIKLDWAGLHKNGWRLRSSLSIFPSQELQRWRLGITLNTNNFPPEVLLTPDLTDLH